MSTGRFKIVGGPSADRLIDSFKYAFEPGCRIPVGFRIEIENGTMRPSSQHIVMIITGLKYESGAFGQLIFEANIIKFGQGRVKGYYNASSREGSFEKL